MKKLLLIGYRGYGDWLYAVPALPALFKQYDIHLETSNRGWELFHDDPRFVSKSLFDADELMFQALTDSSIDNMKIVEERWQAVEDKVKPDKVINLFRTIETKCVAEAWQPEYHLSTPERQAFFGSKDMYEQIFERCEIEFQGIDTDGLYFTQSQIKWAEKWRKNHKNQFIIMIPIEGSAICKKNLYMKDLVYNILNEYPDVVIYLMAGKRKDESEWSHERLFKSFGYASFKQAVLMTKYADMVIGVETGLQAAAGLWGTPKIQFCTMSSVEQLCRHHDNDYSIQADCECSPCHKMINSVYDCDNAVITDYKIHPLCITQLDEGRIFSVINHVFRRRDNGSNNAA